MLVSKFRLATLVCTSMWLSKATTRGSAKREMDGPVNSCHRFEILKNPENFAAAFAVSF
jgi:hypothetical protein